MSRRRQAITVARVHQSVQLADDLIEDSAAWYSEHHVPRAFRKCHPLVLAKVVELNGNDWQRCVVDEDGSVTICNYHAWVPELE